MGSLVFQATLGGQVNLNGPNTASTFDIAVPATTGTMVTTGDSGTVTNTMLAGSIANAKLTNSSVTVGSTSIALGATSTTLDGVNIGATTAGTGAFTTLSASSTVSGTGFSTYLASPPAIGGTTAAAASFTSLAYSTTLTGGTGIVNLGSGQFYKDASGLVGIGTTSPGNKLVVYGADNANRIVSQNSGANATSLIMQANDAGAYIVNSSANSVLYIDNQSTNAQSIVFRNTSSATERMRIDGSGNVGIGTSSPAKKLDVYSTTQRNQIAMSGSNVVAIRWNTTDPNTNERNWEIVNNIDAQGALSFRTGATQTADPTTTRMVIDFNGNVGIGTSSPNASAILDAQSTTKGVRMPNMTTTQKNAISSPAAGLMVFDTTLAKLCVYSGSAWQTITSI